MILKLPILRIFRVGYIFYCTSQMHSNYNSAMHCVVLCPDV